MSTWPQFTGNSNVFRQSYMSGFIDVSGNSIFGGDVSMNARLFVNSINVNNSDLSFSGNTQVPDNTTTSISTSLTSGGIINQYNSNTLINNLTTLFNNDSYVTGNVFVMNDVSINSRLFVGLDTSFNKNLYVKNSMGIGNIPKYQLDVSGGSINTTTGTNNNTYNTNNNNIVSPNAYAATLSGWTTQVGGINGQTLSWTASSSSFNNDGTGWNSFYAFNNYYVSNPVNVLDAFSKANVWGSTSGAYSTTTPFGITRAGALSTPVSGSNYTGEWLQLQSSTPLILYNYYFAGRQWLDINTLANMPHTYYIAGSNNGSDWTMLQSATFTDIPVTYTGNSMQKNYAQITYTSNGAVILTTPSYNVLNKTNTNLTQIQYGHNSTITYSAAGSSYTYFRLIVSNLIGTRFGASTNTAVTMCQMYWNLNFILPNVPFTYSGPSNSLLYVDPSNINQLDVSGSIGIIVNNPPMTVTPHTTFCTSYSWTNNNVNWSCSSSSRLDSNWNPMRLFDLNWLTPSSNNEIFTHHTLTDTYNDDLTGSYKATGTFNTPFDGFTISGEWVQINSSIPLILNTYSFIPRIWWGGSAHVVRVNRMPCIYTFAGSNDGVNWTRLHSGSFTSNPTFTSGAASYLQTNSYYLTTTAGTSIQYSENTTTGYTAAALSYTSFRMIITNVIGTRFGNTSTQWGGNFVFGSMTFSVPTSSSFLSIDTGKANNLNISNNVAIIGDLNVNGTIISNTPSYFWIIIKDVTSTIAIAAQSKIPFDRVFESNYPSAFNSSDNTFYAPVSGRYYIVLSVYSYTSGRIHLYKNGGLYTYLGGDNAGLINQVSNYKDLLYLNTGDYINFMSEVAISVYFANRAGYSIEYFHTALRITYLG
jgi:hypothetical protein